MDNPLYHPVTPGERRQHLLSRYNTTIKLRALSDRFQEPAASYNRFIRDAPLIDQTIAACVVLLISMSADKTKFADQNGNPSMELTRASLESVVILHFCLYLIGTGVGDLAALSLVMLIISEMVLLESEEMDFFQQNITCPLPLGSSLVMFDASRSGNGYDCAICQEGIGETEWIYPVC